MEIAIIASAFIANALTGVFNDRRQKMVLSEEALKARRIILRGLNALLAIVALVATSWVLGEPLDVDSFSSQLETLFAAVATFLVSQGNYHVLFKK